MAEPASGQLYFPGARRPRAMMRRTTVKVLPEDAPPTSRVWRCSPPRSLLASRCFFVSPPHSEGFVFRIGLPDDRSAILSLMLQDARLFPAHPGLSKKDRQHCARRLLLGTALRAVGCRDACRTPWPQVENQTRGPNSTSTGVGVLTSVLNLSFPFAGWTRKTAMVSVF